MVRPQSQPKAKSKPNAPVTARRHRGISCSDLEWVTIKENAAAKGMSISAFLVERAMTHDLTPDAAPENLTQPEDPLALSPREQRHLYDLVQYIAERLERVTGTIAADHTLREMINFQFMKAIDELVTSGRYDEFDRIMDKVTEREK